jgi:hypothetical protein
MGESQPKQPEEVIYTLPLFLGIFFFSLAIVLFLLAFILNDKMLLLGSAGFLTLAHRLFKESRVYKKWRIKI